MTFNPLPWGFSGRAGSQWCPEAYTGVLAFIWSVLMPPPLQPFISWKTSWVPLFYMCTHLNRQTDTRREILTHASRHTVCMYVYKHTHMHKHHSNPPTWCNLYSLSNLINKSLEGCLKPAECFNQSHMHWNWLHQPLLKSEEVILQICFCVFLICATYSVLLIMWIVQHFGEVCFVYLLWVGE